MVLRGGMRLCYLGLTHHPFIYSLTHSFSGVCRAPAVRQAHSVLGLWPQNRKRQRRALASWSLHIMRNQTLNNHTLGQMLKRNMENSRNWCKVVREATSGDSDLS